MPQLLPRSTTTRVFILLFLSLNFLFLLTSSGRVRTRDELGADLQAESLATRFSTATPQAPAFFFYGKLDRNGQPQPPYGVAHAAFLVPWYVAGRILRAILPGIPESQQDAALDAVVVAGSATFSALAAAFAFLIFVRLGLATRTAVYASLILALATPIFSYSSWLYSEPLTAAILLAAVYALFTGGDGVTISIRQAALGGLLLGIALWVRPTQVIVAPVFLAAILIRDGKKGWNAAVVATGVVGLFGVAFLLRNLYLFGNPFDLGYPAITQGGKSMNAFDTPLSTGLYGFLLSPGKSDCIFAPPIILAIAGLRKLARIDRGLAFVAAATPLVFLGFFARYRQWEGGFCSGPRYLIPGIALLCLGLGPMLRDAGPWVRRSAAALFAAGLSVQVITSATSYFEDEAGGNYYDTKFYYRLDYNPLVTMSRQLAHYMFSSEPAQLGRGFDRWFVFLSQAGIAHNTILALLLVQIAGMLFFSARLTQELRRPVFAARATSTAPSPEKHLQHSEV